MILLRYTFHMTLLMLDFLIYILPVLLLCLIPNIIISLLTYLPSIFQIYSHLFYIISNDLRKRIYLFLSFPIIVALYIPIYMFLIIGYCIFVTLIYPFVIIIKRPEYPYYSISSTAAIIYLIYQSISHNSDYQLLNDTPILKPFDNILFSKTYLNLDKLHIYEFIFSIIVNILDIFLISLIFFMMITPLLFVVTLFLTMMKNLLIGSIYNTHESYKEYKYSLTNNPIFIIKFCYVISLLSLPFILLFWLLYYTVYVVSNSLFLLITMMIILFKILIIYKKNDFYNVMVLFLVIIVKIFLTKYNFFGYTLNLLSHNNLEIDELIYICFGIDIYKFGENILDESNNIINSFLLF